VTKEVLYNANLSTQSILGVRNHNTSLTIVNFLLGPSEYTAEDIPFMGISKYEE
jgi:hypothetical protein